MQTFIESIDAVSKAIDLKNQRIHELESVLSDCADLIAERPIIEASATGELRLLARIMELLPARAPEDRR